MIPEIKNQGKDHIKKFLKEQIWDSGGDNMMLHGAEKDVRAITLCSPIVIIKEHDF